MKILFIIVFITLIKYTFCYINKGKFFELDKADEEAYLVVENCEKVYICNDHSKSGILGLYGDDILDGCYYRDEFIGTINVDDGNFNNPIKCSLIRYAHVSTEACFMTNYGKNKIKGKYNSLETTYYDIDIYNNRVLTEMGWCTYLYEHIDVHWMSYINPDLKLNQINLPGTHDTGTYDITKVKKNTNIFSQLLDFYLELPKTLFTQTQDLDITEQLKNGIRYFDIRLDLNKKTNLLYLTHNGVDCYDSKNEDYLYFESVLKYCIDFLIEHPSETVILHLKKEHYAKEEEDKKIAELVESVITKNYNEDSTYLDYVYIPDKIDKDFTNKYMPSLGDVKGRIVFLSRSEFYYKNVKKITSEYDFISSDTFPIGFLRNVTDKGKCSTFPLSLVFSMDDEKCKPEVINNYRVQDNYQLEVKIKWDYVEKMLTDKSKFNDKNNNLTHTLNFMNVAFLNNLPIPFGSMYINKQLTDFLKKNPAPNEWFILDFPTIDVIREIYNSNFDENRPVYKPNKSNAMNLDSIIKEKNKKDSLIACIMTFNFACIFGDSDDPHTYAGRRDITNKELDEKSFVCLQRKIITDEQGNKQDIVKFNYKCVDNNLNKWHIEESNDSKIYSIVSSYDNKCLNYSNDTLYMQECKNNNKYQEFTIKDDIICSRIDSTKCLNGFNIYPTAIKPKKYENLSCSINFARLGVKCCSNQNTQVQYVDEIGNWGIEKSELCGIGYERCSFSAFGYDCCSSVNPEIIYSDDLGNWGFEDGQWCGIGEAIVDSRVRIKNRKTQECLITNLHSDTNVVLMGDCNHSVWNYQNEQLVLDATGKCLYAMNSQDPRMVDCNQADDQINHHIHFKIVDNKYICIKNNVDPVDRCLNGNTNNRNSLKFETNKDEYSEWYIESWNDKVIDSIEEIVRNKPDLHFGIFKPITTTLIPTITTSITIPTSDCYVKTGFPCCSPGNTEVIEVDENGKWGIENDNWCVLIENIHTTTTTTKTTTTSTKKTTTTTIINNVLPTSSTQIAYIYNKGYNKCLYAPTQKGNAPVFGDCDSSNKRNKWFIPTSGKGYYQSVNNNWCLQVQNINNGSVIVSDCNENSMMQDITQSYGGEAIWSTLSDNKCLGYLNSKINFNVCNTNNVDQHWMIIPDGRCGKDYGNLKCSNNQCCSKHNWCGITDNYCSTDCQPNYGLCRRSDGKCGDGIGRCVNNYCCSKNGYCGITDAYCSIGCQNSFGVCN